MEVDLANILFSWLLHFKLACIGCNTSSLLGPFAPFGALASALATVAGGLASAYNYASGDAGPPVVQGVSDDAAENTGLGLNDLFGETGGGVGDTTNPTYSDTTAMDRQAAADARIAADEARQQFTNQFYRATHPGATTAGPTQPTTAEQAGGIFRRAVESHIKGEAEGQ